MFLFISQVISNRLQTEIDRYFAEIFKTEKPLRFASSASFSKARNKIDSAAFKDVSDKLVEKYYKQYSYQKFYGYRILAIDGSIYTIPATPETIEYFGNNVLSQSKEWVKARGSHMSDVINNVVVDHAVDAYKASEQSLAKQHLRKCNNEDILLFDRGYWGYDFMEQVYETGAKFCFRVSTAACKAVIDFIKNKEIDTDTIIKTKNYKITIRLTKIKLESGEIEYLLTNFTDRKAFPVSKLKKLYHLRWGVEEQYKDMKYALVIENFSGKKVNSVLQDIHAKILIYNLTMISCKSIVDQKVKQRRRKHKYILNKRAALSKISEYFIQIIAYGDRILNHIIQLLVNETVPIRPNRKRKRKPAHKIKPKPRRQYISVV